MRPARDPRDRPDTDGPDALDLLDIDAVVAAARAAGADAVHPGFGFLAENADFAEAVDRRRDPLGRPAAGRDPGDGRQGRGPPARRLARRPGPRRLRRRRPVRRRARSRRPSRIGFPLLVKPAAGGGGKGMRTVRDAGARWPTRSPPPGARPPRAFGDDRLILERLVDGARHVEIQVLFDGHGTGVSPRRARLLDPAAPPEGPRGVAVAGGRCRRSGARLGEAALTLARRRRLRRAPGPASSCVDDRGRADLPRDEHPAPGRAPGHRARHRPRPRRRPAPDRRRRAARVRPGRRRPAGAATRSRSASTPRTPRTGSCPRPGGSRRCAGRPATGSGSTPGSSSATEIGGRFDPMLAKIIAWGPDRADGARAARRRARRTVVLGVVTNLRFLRWLVRQPVVRAGDARTDILTRIWPPDDWAERDGDPRRRLGGRGGRPARDGRRCGATRGPAAGGSTRRASVRLEADGDRARRSIARSDAPRPTPRRPSTFVRVGDTVHLDLAGRSVAFRARATARRRRRGPGGRRARRRRARPDRSTSSRRCRAPS